MVDGAQSEGEVPSTLPGLAELFAICYRTQWKALGLTHPDALVSQSFRIRPPLPLSAAHANIIELLRAKPGVDDLPPDFKGLEEPALYALNIARMGLAQLARATALEGAPPIVHTLYAQLAAALEADLDFGRIQDEYADEMQQQPDPGQVPAEPIERFRAQDLLESIENLERDTPDIRFFTTFAYDSLRLLNGRNSPPPVLCNYALARSYRDRVVDTTASVDVNRPASELFPIVDPCLWHENLPTLWPKPTTFIVSDPVDRSSDGVPCPPPAGGTAKCFFEQAQFAWGIMPVTCYRNLLTITIDDSQKTVPPPRAFGFTYSERSCLTSEFFGVASQAGGIDVDHGNASVRDLTGTEAGFCRFTSRKASRFDIPKDPLLNRIYNDIAAIGLSLLIEAFTLFGAVAPTPAE